MTTRTYNTGIAIADATHLRITARLLPVEIVSQASGSRMGYRGATPAPLNDVWLKGYGVNVFQPRLGGAQSSYEYSTQRMGWFRGKEYRENSIMTEPQRMIHNFARGKAFDDGTISSDQ